jgi:uncharacterized membrane protein
MLLPGSGAYLAGPLGVTAAFNVPLNNTLAATGNDQAARVWPEYVSAWVRWNHTRTALVVAATTFLSFALVLGY